MSIALRHRTVRRIALLFTASVLLEWAVGIALMVMVYGASGSATAAAAMLVCTQLLPNLGVALAASRFDAMAVRPVFVAATAAQAVGALVIAATGYGVAFYVAAFVIGAGSSVARAQLRTGIARADGGDGDLLRAGNALLGVLRGPAGLLGPAAAGLCIALLGGTATVLVIGCAQLALVLAAVGLPAMRPVGASVSDAVEADADRPVTAASTVPVGVLLATAGVMLFLFSVDEPVLLAYADQALGAGSAGYSAIFVAWGAGLLLGGLVFARMLRVPMLTVFALGLALNVLGHIGLLTAPSLGFALVGALVGGIGNGMDWSALSTAIQEAAPAGQEGRTAGRLESLATIGCGLGIVAGGLFADVAGPRATLAIPVFGGIAILIAGLLYLRAHAAGWRAPNLPEFSPSIQGAAS